MVDNRHSRFIYIISITLSPTFEQPLINETGLLHAVQSFCCCCCCCFFSICNAFQVEANCVSSSNVSLIVCPSEWMLNIHMILTC